MRERVLRIWSARGSVVRFGGSFNMGESELPEDMIEIFRADHFSNYDGLHDDKGDNHNHRQITSFTDVSKHMLSDLETHFLKPILKIFV